MKINRLFKKVKRSEQRYANFLSMTGQILALSLIFLSNSCQKHNENPENTYQPKISIILARPTGSSIIINFMSDMDTEVYWEYSTAKGSYTSNTANYAVSKNIPIEVSIENLTSGTKYYYRTRYRPMGSSGAFISSSEHSFQTWRQPGIEYKFAIEADPHLDYNSDTAAYSLTLANIAAENPDFLLDLGDTFMSEKLPSPILAADIQNRHLLLRSYFEKICHSVSLYLVLGNHEGELGWRNDGSTGSLPVIITNTRKVYYSNPVPDNFYSGNSRPEANVGLRQNYYSWEWGDALFVVLDPFWYTTVKSGWGFTLGKEQYDWFKEILTNSNARFKFVFCHNLVGGNGNDARGGSEFADFFEMGGYDTDGTWGFGLNRPGWDKPLHTIMKETNVTVFFHGHDHFFGKQEKDGIVYQEVPQPSNKNITNISASEYGYTDGLFLPGRGFLLVTVSGQNVEVDYIGTYLPGEENAGRKNATLISTYTVY